MTTTTKKPSQPSLRTLAAELGTTHGALSGAYRGGRLPRGLELVNGKLVVLDAAQVAEDWRSVRSPLVVAAQRARAAKWQAKGQVAGAGGESADSVELHNGQLVVREPDETYYLDPVVIYRRFRLACDALDLLAAAALKHARDGRKLRAELARMARTKDDDDGPGLFLWLALEAADPEEKDS